MAFVVSEMSQSPPQYKNKKVFIIRNAPYLIFILENWLFYSRKKNLENIFYSGQPGKTWNWTFQPQAPANLSNSKNGVF